MFCNHPTFKGVARGWWGTWPIVPKIMPFHCEDSVAQRVFGGRRISPQLMCPNRLRSSSQYGKKNKERPITQHYFCFSHLQLHFKLRWVQLITRISCGRLLKFLMLHQTLDQRRWKILEFVSGVERITYIWKGVLGSKTRSSKGRGIHHFPSDQKSLPPIFRVVMEQIR